MPSGILKVVRGSRWVILQLLRIWSSITAGVSHGLQRLVLRWHLARARAELHRLGLCVPVGVWFCDGCSQVLWDMDSFRSHNRMHAG
jgi:hypothetical protein